MEHEASLAAVFEVVVEIAWNFGPQGSTTIRYSLGSCLILTGLFSMIIWIGGMDDEWTGAQMLRLH